MGKSVKIGKTSFDPDNIKGMSKAEFKRQHKGSSAHLDRIWEAATGKKWDDGPTEPRKERTGRKRSTEKDSPEAGD